VLLANVATVKVRIVWPAANARVPLASEPSTKGSVATKSTVTGVVVAPVRLTVIGGREALAHAVVAGAELHDRGERRRALLEHREQAKVTSDPFMKVLKTR